MAFLLVNVRAAISVAGVLDLDFGGLRSSQRHIQLPFYESDQMICQHSSISLQIMWMEMGTLCKPSMCSTMKLHLVKCYRACCLTATGTAHNGKPSTSLHQQEQALCENWKWPYFLTRVCAHTHAQREFASQTSLVSTLQKKFTGFRTNWAGSDLPQICFGSQNDPILKKNYLTIFWIRSRPRKCICQLSHSSSSFPNPSLPQHTLVVPQWASFHPLYAMIKVYCIHFLDFSFLQKKGSMCVYLPLQKLQLPEAPLTLSCLERKGEPSKPVKHFYHCMLHPKQQRRGNKESPTAPGIKRKGVGETAGETGPWLVKLSLRHSPAFGI